MNIAFSHQSEISRRSMLAGLGGLSFCIAFGSDGFRLFAAADADTSSAAKQVGSWVRISADGTINILSAGAEMGQGSMTGLPLIVAEEMDADWSKVTIDWAPADKDVYGYTFTNSQRMMAIVGSRATQLYYNDLRIAGAQVRKVLLMNAGQKWGVDPASLKTEPSVVIDPATGRRLSYGEIAEFATIPTPLPSIAENELKAKKDFRLIGKAVPRRDIPAKVNGSAQFAIDVKLPDMVYATTLHSPVHNSAPESWNEAEVKKMPGVIGVMPLSNGIAVVADRFERALTARNALKVTWKKGLASGFDSQRVLEEDYEKIHEDPAAQVETLESKGDINAAFRNAAKVYRAEFRSDYGYHAQMEPLNAVARLSPNGNHVEVWEGSQAPDASRAAVAKALGFREDQVTFNQCYMGGGFGRRSLGEYPAEAALIAAALASPSN